MNQVVQNTHKYMFVHRYTVELETAIFLICYYSLDSN